MTFIVRSADLWRSFVYISTHNRDVIIIVTDQYTLVFHTKHGTIIMEYQLIKQDSIIFSDYLHSHDEEHKI